MRLETVRIDVVAEYSIESGKAKPRMHGKSVIHVEEVRHVLFERDLDWPPAVLTEQRR